MVLFSMLLNGNGTPNGTSKWLILEIDNGGTRGSNGHPLLNYINLFRISSLGYSVRYRSPRRYLRGVCSGKPWTPPAAVWRIRRSVSHLTLRYSRRLVQFQFWRILWVQGLFLILYNGNGTPLVPKNGLHWELTAEEPGDRQWAPSPRYNQPLLEISKLKYPVGYWMLTLSL